MTRYATSNSLHALRAAALAAALILAPFAAARAQGIALSLSATGGVLSGAATELVMDGGYKLSELDWASSPLALWGLGAELRLRSGFYARAGLASGLAGRTGYMTDSDWQNFDGIKTNFSQSDSYTDRALLFHVEAGYAIGLSDWIALEPFLRLEYLDFQWSARGGYLQYPPEAYGSDANGDPIYGPYTPISGNTPAYKMYGIGIVYEQRYTLPSLGIRLSLNPGYRFGISASIAASPFASLQDLDNHVVRSLVFKGKMQGYSLEPALSLSYELSPAASLGFELKYIRIAGLSGDMTETDFYGVSYSAKGAAAASFDAVTAGTTIKLRL